MTLRSTTDRPGPTPHRVWRLPAADALRGRRALWWTVGPAGELAVLVTDADGSIWTAYGDEGIYGSHPESGAGLAGWNARGEAIWSPGGRLPDHPLQGCTAATEDHRAWLVW
ncbi:hypothetical protein ACFYUH_25650 [Streptomyces fimicarius]|uniref:hypothetical protein n=1 Tax=Streptomyces griseus TaxID=1911 RepID=UPI0036C27101